MLNSKSNIQSVVLIMSYSLFPKISVFHFLLQKLNVDFLFFIILAVTELK